MFLPISQPRLSFSWYMVIICHPEAVWFILSSLYINATGRVTSIGGGEVWQVSEMHPPFVWWAFKSCHTHTHNKNLKSVRTYKSLVCTARTHWTRNTHKQPFRHIHTYTHTHGKLRNCHIRLWINAASILKKQQNAIFSDSNHYYTC